jgi:hypothetical protein
MRRLDKCEGNYSRVWKYFGFTEPSVGKGRINSIEMPNCEGGYFESEDVKIPPKIDLTLNNSSNFRLVNMGGEF